MDLSRCLLAHGGGPGHCGWCPRPLPPRRRRWCSNACAAAWADHHVWEAAKLAALVRAGYACEKCGATDWESKLEVHHARNKVIGRARYGTGCWNHQRNLMVLCAREHLDETRWERARGRPVQLTLVA
jgi:hypothetical protein